MTTKENPHVIKKTTPPFIPNRPLSPNSVRPQQQQQQQQQPQQLNNPTPPTPQQATDDPPRPNALAMPNAATPPRTSRSGRVIRKPFWMKDMVVSQVFVNSNRR